MSRKNLGEKDISVTQKIINDFAVSDYAELKKRLLMLIDRKKSSSDLLSNAKLALEKLNMTTQFYPHSSEEMLGDKIRLLCAIHFLLAESALSAHEIAFCFSDANAHNYRKKLDEVKENMFSFYLQISSDLKKPAAPEATIMDQVCDGAAYAFNETVKAVQYGSEKAVEAFQEGVKIASERAEPYLKHYAPQFWQRRPMITAPRALASEEQREEHRL
ncbi:MAG: hypothetical protein NTU49_01045 [Gammaproteobacteria bacterium]|nr:hypothetical protein [Gammaproteobacteria bacterium]